MEITPAALSAAIIVAIPALTRLAVVLIALRGTKPAERPEILRALHPFSFNRGDAPLRALGDGDTGSGARDP